MRWSPKPSTVAMVGVGLAALVGRTVRHSGGRGRTTLSRRLWPAR
jgi:hypothetical protein